jgi:hypothetical protein
MAALKSGLNEAGSQGYQQVTDIASKYICIGTFFCGANWAKVALWLGSANPRDSGPVALPLDKAGDPRSWKPPIRKLETK